MPRAANPARRRVPAARLVALCLLVVLLGACRLAVVTRVVVDDAGAGTLAVVVEVDRETADQLAATGVSLVPTAQAGWTVDAVEGGDALAVTLSTAFADPDELAARVQTLGEGLDDEDPRLLDAIVLRVVDRTIALDATAGLRLPSSAGADIAGWPTADDLRELAASSDVTARLVVTAPGPIVTAAGAPVEVRGATATFELPVGEAADIVVTSRAPTILDTSWWTVATVLVGLVLVVAGFASLMRRRRARREAPLGRVRGMRAPY